MNSQLNNNQENNDQVFSEDNTFRTVFFDSSKRVISATTTNNQESTHTKRARLDSTISLNHPNNPTPNTPTTSAHHHHQPLPHVATDSNSQDGKLDIPPLSFETNNIVSTPTACIDDVSEQILEQHQKKPIQQVSSSLKRKHHKSSSSSKIRKFRSRSLPNILFTSKNLDFFNTKFKEPTASIFNNTTNAAAASSTSSSHHHHHTTTTNPPPPLPPVNIQSLREIDLAEILKNPQLRHDILFDPQLQFRPNLDGERGRRKKVTYDKYWSGVQHEIEEYFKNQHVFTRESSRLPNLFQTLRDILISLLPSKDKQSVIDVLDIELIMQQLSKNSLDFIKLAKWLSSIFKSHCAPMRDSWVDEMLMKFVEADDSKSVNKLVEGLRMIFTILEAMKLDVANHQIRILRPVLVETAVEFERDYFLQMISRCKLDISDSIKWFRQFQSTTTPSSIPTSETPKLITTQAILSLLSCSKMVSEFPSSLAFDHARLIVLRANVRQVVCLQLCIALFKQLAHQSNNGSLITNENIESLKKEILALITDENGNVKWTRNIGAIALQISRRSNPQESIPNESKVEFAFSWLIKQTQPSSQVYSLMEQRVFQTIKTKVQTTDLEKINNILPVNGSINLNSVNPTTTTSSNGINQQQQENDEDDIGSIASRISLLAKFHWNVFGSYYSEN